MPSKSDPAAHRTSADTTQAVDRFMAELQHPFKAGIQRLREVIAAADPSICEGIKWNSPSFRTTEYFATMHLRAKTGVGLILHFGAKVRSPPAAGVAIEDPAALLQWLGKDRAMVVFSTIDDVERHGPALQSVLRQWLRLV